MKSETLGGTKTETLHAVDAESAARPRLSFFQRHESMILGGGAVVIALAVWEAIWSLTDWISPLFFSGPSAIAKQFRYLLLEGTLVADMKYSGKNFALGFALALVAGVVIGVITGWYRRIRLVADPFLNALYGAADHYLVRDRHVVQGFRRFYLSVLSNSREYRCGDQEYGRGPASSGARVLCFGLADFQDPGDSGLGAFHSDRSASGSRAGADRSGRWRDVWRKRRCWLPGCLRRPDVRNRHAVCGGHHHRVRRNRAHVVGRTAGAAFLALAAGAVEEKFRNSNFEIRTVFARGLRGCPL